VVHFLSLMTIWLPTRFLRVDDQRSLEVAGEPVADLVADHEDLGKAGVGEAELLLVCFFEAKS